MKKWLAGIAGTILTGVVVYWLTVGLRHDGNAVTPTRVMDVRVNAPRVVRLGGSADVQVEVLSGPNSPIADAQVRIDVGGGFFRRSNGLVSEGLTNPHGFYADAWTSPPGSAGITYLITVRVSKAGFEDVSRRLEISVK
jgi:hypothetical protein